MDVETPQGEGGQRSGTWWRWLLGIGLLAAVVAALAPTAKEAFQELPKALEHLDPIWLLGTVLAQAGMYTCLAGILATGLSALGYRNVPFRSLIPTGAVFLLANRALPGPAVVGLAMMVARLKRRGVPKEAGHAVAATFFGGDYVGFLALAAIVLPLLVAGGRLGALHPKVLLIALSIIFVGAGIGAWAYQRPGMLEGAAERAGRALARLRRNSAAEEWGQRGREGVTTFRAHALDLVRQPGALLRAAAWGLALHACEAVTLVLAARAFGADVPFPIASAGYVAGNLGAIVSFLPGGVGLYEGSMIAALHTVGGVDLPIATAATLVYRLLSLWLPLPFAILLVRRFLTVNSSETK